MKVAVFYAKFNEPPGKKKGILIFKSILGWINGFILFYKELNFENILIQDLDGDDHLVVRLIGDNKSNTTMYTFKLFHVGQVTISVSR